MDHDLWRRRMRQARHITDRAKVHVEIEQLANDVDVTQQPVWTMKNLADGLMALGAGERAVALLRQVQQRHPNDLWANHNLAPALWNSNQLDEAKRCFTVVAALRPDSAGAHLNLGGCFLDKGNLEEAIGACQQALQIEPNDCGAHTSMAEILISVTGRTSEQSASALRHAQRSVELVPTHPNPWLTPGLVQYRSGQWQEAQAALSKSEALRPSGRDGGAAPTAAVADANNDVKLWLLLAMAHWQLGHRDEAQTWYDAVAQRMNDRAADDDTKRLRAEAEELLGIAATPSEPSEQHETPAEIPQ